MSMLTTIAIVDSYIISGHHRVLTMYLGGRNILRSDEYFWYNSSYEEISEPRFEQGWFTPYGTLFNPFL